MASVVILKMISWNVNRVRLEETGKVSSYKYNDSSKTEYKHEKKKCRKI